MTDSEINALRAEFATKKELIEIARASEKATKYSLAVVTDWLIAITEIIKPMIGPEKVDQMMQKISDEHDEKYEHILK